MNREKLLALVQSYLPVFVLLCFWQICAFLLGPSRCPRLIQILVSLFESFFQDSIIEAQGGGANGFSSHIVVTLFGFIEGFVIGSFSGIICALIINQSKALSKLLEPALEFFRALPPLLVIPFAILLCRSSDMLECFTVALYSAFSMAVYTFSIVKNIAPNYLHLAKLLGASSLRRIFDVQIQAAMPELLGAFRVTAPLSLGIAVVVEYMASPAGLGRVMKFAISYARVDLIMVSVVWVVCIAVAVDFLINLSFRQILKW